MSIFRQPELLDRYLETHSGEEDPVLVRLARYTFLNHVHPRMLSGPVLGGFLTLFSTLLRPLRILEIGTYTGYSAICLAKGLAPGGRLTTLDTNEEVLSTAARFFRESGLDDCIEPVRGDALEVIPRLSEGFELVFLDAAKELYPGLFPVILEKMAPGGYLLADNTLWDGKVIDPSYSDPETLSIREFNQIVSEDRRVESLLLPIRDGVMVIKKR